MRYWLFVIIFLFSLGIKGQAKILSDSAEISLLTCSPGNELYSIYGHSAIRVNDPIQNLDVVFNFGTFDFDTPHFYLKFANGELNYMLSVANYSRFIQGYFQDNRSVWEQVLNLTADQKQSLFSNLVINARPENRFYRYDFFFDNCATRIRDVIYKELKSEVSYGTLIEEDHTFRDYIHEYMNKVPWVSDGLDLLLGLGTDNMASVSQQMFLPDYLMVYFGKSTFVVNGEARPLVKEMKPLLKFDQESTPVSILKPSFIMWFLFLLTFVLFIWELLYLKKPLLLYSRFVFLISGLVGGLICFLWFFTLHNVTSSNYNLMWALPTNLIIAFLPRKILFTNISKLFIILSAIPLVFLICFGFLIPQQLPAIVYPFALILLVRMCHILIFPKSTKR